jgi:hypothetical protein
MPSMLAGIPVPQSTSIAEPKSTHICPVERCAATLCRGFVHADPTILAALGRPRRRLTRGSAAESRGQASPAYFCDGLMLTAPAAARLLAVACRAKRRR